MQMDSVIEWKHQWGTNRQFKFLEGKNWKEYHQNLIGIIKMSIHNIKGN